MGGRKWIIEWLGVRKMKIRIAIITTCLLVVFTAGCKENMEVVEKEEQFKKARIKMVQEQMEEIQRRIKELAKEKP